MTANQKIINGVNVQDCVMFRDDVYTDKQLLDVCSIGLWQRHYQNLEENCVMSCNCKDNPNCHYKQLARKTAECKVLEDQLMESSGFNKIEQEADMQMYYRYLVYVNLADQASQSRKRWASEC